MWACAAGGGEPWLRPPRCDTNPLNRDPLVREAFEHFYNLDYPGAVERFERFHAAHPGDPQATALLLDAVLFQELYRQDLLDTTFYANDGFLTGRHATEEDPKTRDRILGLADEAIHEADWRLEQESQRRGRALCAGWARSLKCTYMAMVERGFGAGFRLATKAKDDEVRVLQLDPDYVDAKLVVGVYEYVVGALPWPFKLLIGFAGITGSKSQGPGDAERRRQSRRDHQRGGAHGDCAVSAPRGEVQRGDPGGSRTEERVSARFSLLPGRGQPAQGRRRGHGRGGGLPGDCWPIAPSRDIFAEAQLELAYFGLGDALRGQRHFGEAAQAYEQAAWTKNVGPELKIRSLLAAGECRDLNGERQLAVKDYQAAIDAGPDTSRADTARKHLRNPYTGN